VGALEQVDNIVQRLREPTRRTGWSDQGRSSAEAREPFCRLTESTRNCTLGPRTRKHDTPLGANEWRKMSRLVSDELRGKRMGLVSCANMAQSRNQCQTHAKRFNRSTRQSSCLARARSMKMNGVDIAYQTGQTNSQAMGGAGR
jgi:hypothetical protein